MSLFLFFVFFNAGQLVPAARPSPNLFGHVAVACRALFVAATSSGAAQSLDRGLNSGVAV